MATFRSYPDASGRFTQLEINPNGCKLVSITNKSNNTKETTFTSKFVPQCMFRIEFQPIHLAGSSGGLPNFNALPRIFELTADTAPDDKGSSEGKDDSYRTWYLRYDHVPEKTSDPDKAAEIQVTVTFRAVNASHESGWIHMELDHTYPDADTEDDTETEIAWETNVIFPKVGYGKANLQQFSIIDPRGFTNDAYLAARSRNAANQLHNESFLPIQFLAWYKRYGWDASDTSAKRLGAVIMHGTDAHGYYKTAGYYPRGLGPGQVYASNVGTTDETNKETDIYLRLKAPIFWKLGANNKRVYTHAPNFRLGPALVREQGLGKRIQGYGGAVMSYRIKAALIFAYNKQDAIDWQQVADEYKNWLEATKPGFWKRVVRAATLAPTDMMGPFTTISNYSILSPVAAPVIPPPPDLPDPEHQKVHNAQVIYPITATTGKTDLPARLGQLKNWYNYNSTDPVIPLEAQIWGWEKGGYYFLAGDREPAWNALNGTTTDFKTMVTNLLGNGIWTSITTDPTWPRHRGVHYLGHLRPGKEDVEKLADVDDSDFWWRYPYPSSFANGTVKLDPSISQRAYITDFTEAGTPSLGLANRNKYRLVLNLSNPDKIEADLGMAFLGVVHYRLCPSSGLKGTYCQGWLQNGLIAHIGNPLLEFMNHSYEKQGCYRTDHDHVSSNSTYGGVIGYGPWFVAKLNDMLLEARTKYANANISNSFAITNEFTPTEFFISNFAEYYDNTDMPPFTASTVVVYGSRPTLAPNSFNQFFPIPFASYIYSGKLPARMSMARQTPHAHPGFKVAMKAANDRKERKAWVFEWGALATATLPTLPAPIDFKNFTLEVWLVPMGSTGMDILWLGDDATKNLMIQLVPSSYGYQVKVTVKEQVILSDQHIAWSTWAHIACVGSLTSDKMRYDLFVNGLKDKWLDVAMDVVPEALALGMGGKPNATTGTYVGLMDEVRLWDTPRSQRDICATMYRTLSGWPSVPRVHLDMDTSAADAVTNNLITMVGTISDKPTHFNTDKDLPTYMLDGVRDSQSSIPPFWSWRYVCEAFASHYYQVEDTGVSPQGLVTSGKSIYSYNRAVEDLFNLRFNIFRICRIAVQGRRIYVPAYFFEEPVNINLPLCMVARAAVLMQTELSAVFVHGRMLGEVGMVTQIPFIDTWYAPWRSFHDVVPLYHSIKVKFTQVPELALPNEHLRDSISVGIDTPDPDPLDLRDPNSVIRPTRVSQEQVSHMVWQGPIKVNGEYPIYYVFSNSGNKPFPLTFYIHRGLKPQVTYNYTPIQYDSTKDTKDTARTEDATGTVKLANQKFLSITIPPRSFKVVRLIAQATGTM